MRKVLPGLGVAAFVATLALAILPASATAAQIIGPQDPNDPQVDSPWQAGTCKDDGPPECSIDTKEKFFEGAAAHPPVGFTQFIINTEEGPLPETEIPVANLRTVRVDIPPGLTVNPQATPEMCDLEPEESPAGCPPGSKVGTSTIRATNPLTGFTQALPTVDVFNIVPEPGEPARFGFSVLGNDVFLETDIEWQGDYHEYFTIHAHQIEVGIPGLEVARIAESRLVFDGTAGNGTFITTPTNCLGPSAPGSPFEHAYSTWLRADSFEEPNPGFPDGSNFVESKIPRKPGEFETSPKDCDSIPFDPAINVDPNTAVTDAPSGATVVVTLPEIEGAKKQATSHVRSARVTLPIGMGLNPSAANGLQACTDAQFGKGTRNPVACPPASRVGTVEVDTPPLPDGSLTGPVYVGQQLSRDPTSGEEYRIFVAVESDRYDISARLLGKVSANPVTGQLTTTFDDAPLGKVPISGLPQVPFKSFRFRFNGGARAPLTSPPTCGPNTTTTHMTPWSSAQGTVPVGEEGGPNPTSLVTRNGQFGLTNQPGGGACAKTLAERPFAPGFNAVAGNPVAGSYSQFAVDVIRVDGNQELKGIDVDLPPGLSAKLAGVRYCPESVLAAAAASSGAAELASPSCPGSSLVGSAAIMSGSGPEPISINGKVFLAGPYRGAPLSLAVITPATAGPFDLGTVVVRVALVVDPRTAQVHVVPDAIPHVYGGALLDIRRVLVRIDRPQFTTAPTSCKRLAVGGTLRGGGADPTNPAAFSALPVSQAFRVTGCKRLGFKPKFFLRLFGARKRARNPKLRAVLLPRDGDANIGRAVVTLPRTLFLDQGSLARVCTRVQFAAGKCPKKSIYGFARAFTPLLDGPLKGPVYLRSSDNELPDLVASLRGQVDVELVGRIDTNKGRIRNTFDVVPDVPVKKFILTMRGGRKGLLTNSRDLCGRKGKKGRPIRLAAKFKAHNSRRAKLRPKLRAPCGKRKQAKRHRRNPGHS